MDDKKIKQRIWIAVGVGIFLTIVMAVAAVQLVIKPKRAEIAKVQTDYNTKKATAGQLGANQAALQKALDNKRYAEGQLAFFRQRYRSLYFGDIAGTTPVQQAARDVAWRRWMNEYANDYGLALRREVVNAANATNVVLRTDIKVGPPPKAPEEVVTPVNGLFKPTGGPLAMQVTGSYADIMRFFNRINESAILMLVERDLKLTGYSPEITATFSLTPFLLANGPGAPIQAGAAAAGGASGAGAPGGPSAVPGPSGSPGGSSSSSSSSSGSASNSASPGSSSSGS